MKRIFFILVMAAGAMLITSCGKESMRVVRSDGDNPIPDNYEWTGCSPKPIAFDRSQFLEGSGVNAIYEYYFHVSLDNSQANANGIVNSDICFPHVGPGGVTIYNNVSNDATYELIKVDNNGIVYFKIKTANVAVTGCPLKFNLALKTAEGNVWFSANGPLTQNVGIDDGTNNVYSINFNNGNVTKAW